MKRKLSIFLVLMLLFAGVVSVKADTTAPELVALSKEGTISPDISKIELTFSSALDADTLDGITFTNSDGTDVAGGAYVSRGDSANEAVVSFGLLSDGDYILSVTDSLKGTDGTAAVTDERIYTVSGYDKLTTVYEMDLSKLADGTYEKADIQAGISNSSVNAGTHSGKDYARYEIGTDPDGRYIGAYHMEPSGSVATTLTVSMDKAVSTGTIRIYCNYKLPGNTDLNVNMFRLYNGNGGTVAAATFQSYAKDPELLLMSGSCLTFTSGSSYTCTKDEYGYINLCFEIGRESVSSDWKVTVIDMNSESKLPFAKGTVKASVLGSVQKLYLFDTWPRGGKYKESANSMTAVKNLKVEYVMPQKVAYIEDNINPGAESIRLSLFRNEYDYNVQPVLLDAKGTTVDSEYTFTEDRIVTIFPCDYLAYGSEYTISFQNGIAEDVKVNTNAYKLTIGEVTVKDNIVTVPLVYGNPISEGVTVFVAAKDAQGKLTGIRSGYAAKNAESAQIDISTLTGASYTVYVWENFEDYTAAACEPIVLP